MHSTIMYVNMHNNANTELTSSIYRKLYTELAHTMCVHTYVCMYLILLLCVLFLAIFCDCNKNVKIRSRNLSPFLLGKTLNEVNTK